MSDVIGTKVWQCRLCDFKHLNKKGAVQHFMFRHTPNNQIPFLCNICNFKALTEGKWKNHANAMAGKPLREDSAVHTFHKSTNPYNVKIGSDIFIKTTLITPSTQKSEIKEEEFIPDYDEEITISEEEVAIMEVEVDERDEQIEGLKNKIKEMEEKHREDNRSMEETHKKQIKELEERHKFECLRFGNFIQRLEKRKEELKKELKSAEKKLENENICTKKIKSVVTLPIKRKLNFR
ncbi:unnamed protein product [Mytilus edulis]|uniref:Uncharacterized protein n=1 Tax=Mytilus edulis TaxID=6550 RepID=A0A8S3S117_MYTED|nr:unnamed protein product [Mytilus edulis]